MSRFDRDRTAAHCRTIVLRIRAAGSRGDRPGLPDAAYALSDTVPRAVRGTFTPTSGSAPVAPASASLTTSAVIGRGHAVGQREGRNRMTSGGTASATLTAVAALNSRRLRPGDV